MTAKLVRMLLFIVIGTWIISMLVHANTPHTGHTHTVWGTINMRIGIPSVVILAIATGILMWWEDCVGMPRRESKKIENECIG